LSIRKGNSHNTVFKGCHFYATGTILDLLTQFDVGANTSKNIVFDSCDFSHVSASALDQILVKTGKCTNVIFTHCYFESPQAQLKEYLMELGTATGSTSSIKFVDCVFSGTNFNYFCKLTNVIFLTIENCYFESLPNKALFKASTDPADTVNQYIQGELINLAFSSNIPLIGTDDTRTPLGEEKVFFIINNKSGYYNVHQRGGYKVSNHQVDNYLYRGYDADKTAFPFAFYEARKNGIYLGDGTVAQDVGFVRYAPNVGAMAPGDNFKVDGSWNGGHLQMGGWHLWVDAAGKLRILGSAPTGDLVGTVIGSQT
jgi:hypothetical protein